MAISSRPRLERFIHRAAAIALTLVAFIAGTPCVCALSDEYSWDRMVAAVRNLRTDDVAVKLDIAQDAHQIFAPLREPPPGRDETDVRGIVDDLRRWIRMEKNEWISTNLLRDLGIHDDAVLEPLYTDASSSPSPNLRWAGIRWFEWRKGGDALPLLEDLWPDEDRPWVQRDLMNALARRGSKRHIDDFLDLTVSDDQDLAETAIEAASDLKDPRAIPILSRIARNGPQRLARAAVAALASWSDDPPVLELLLDLGRSATTPVRGAAIRALDSSTSPQVGEWLESLALSSEDPWLRTAAAETLARVDPALALPALVKLLHQPASGADSFLRSAVLRALMEIDDPSTLESLSDLDLAADPSLAGDFKTLRESLLRDRENEFRTIVVSMSCSAGTVIMDASDPRLRVLVPPPGMHTLRCWEGPGIAGNPKGLPRLAAGTSVTIDDHFDLAGEPWTEVRTGSFPYCWVPLRFIESPASTHASLLLEQEDTMVIRREFDLPVSEVEGDVAQGLMDAGLLEVIEPGDEVIGVALTVDPADFDRVLLLARSCGLNETILDGEIYDVVADLAPLYRGHPVLDRFRRAPGVKSGDNDEVIDLDLEEMTDK